LPPIYRCASGVFLFSRSLDTQLATQPCAHVCVCVGVGVGDCTALKRRPGVTVQAELGGGGVPSFDFEPTLIVSTHGRSFFHGGRRVCVCVCGTRVNAAVRCGGGSGG
jgi:hypothetical protein